MANILDTGENRHYLANAIAHKIDGYATPTSAEGSPIGLLSHVFLTSNQQTMDISFEVLDDSNNVVNRVTVPNVPLERNRCTILSGPLFSTTASASAFTLNDTWLEDYKMEF